MSDERRKLLEAAWDESEAEEVEEIESEEVEDESEHTEPEGDDGGTEEVEGGVEEEVEQPKAKKEGAQETPGQLKSKKEKEQPIEGELQPKASKEGELKAPNSWKPTEREFWGKMPKEAQQAVARRESEIQKALSHSAGSRKFVDQFLHVVNPYAHLIRAQNSTPLDAVNNLMQTAARLTTGNTTQKAQVLLEILNNYNVDIREFDNLLTAQIKGNGGRPPVQDNSLPPQFAAALKPVYDFMNTVQSRAQQVEEQRTMQAVETVESYGANKDFFDDVREDMADVMEAAARRGKRMSMDQAYKIAVDMNPEISAAIQQRRRAATAQANGTNIARARRAASSISGAPVNTGGKGPPNTRRQFLEQAWDDSTD